MVSLMLNSPNNCKKWECNTVVLKELVNASTVPNKYVNKVNKDYCLPYFESKSRSSLIVHQHQSQGTFGPRKLAVF